MKKNKEELIVDRVNDAYKELLKNKEKIAQLYNKDDDEELTKINDKINKQTEKYNMKVVFYKKKKRGE